ncbi:septation protein A [Hydromonas duriensis]|uniref:Inner membrane-spanning protein YciB n=1 Tax=Hydromonas duriensis TaxID=1527608 RepID=A0A4R6YBS4_9BURK|nr:septation protein A [Hydromonas duriensis]TDR33116.1 intracellular septation protein A [Hydromonas duriensis]
MKALIDFFPIVLFFLSYKLTNDMFLATGVAMASTAVQMLLMKWKKIPIQIMHWMSLVLIVVLGSMSIYFHETIFLKWKFSVLEWTMGAAILIGQYVFNKNMLKILLGHELHLSDEAWKKFGLMWAGFFIFLGTLNIYIAYNFSDDVWFNFKLYGSLGLILVFAIVQEAWLSKQLPKDE